MDKDKLLEKIKRNPDFNKVGMIASHLGIVRGHSRNGKKVTAVEVTYDTNALDDIIKEIRTMPGITDVLIEVNSGTLNVGDEVMYFVVAGDIRENVFAALIKGVDMIKKDGSKKREIYEN